MSYDYRSLCWEDVEEGQALPGFTYELSLLRLVAFVRATGLYDFVHHDSRYARAAGAKDAFISTPHLAGLFSRLITDWSGPGSVLRRLAFGMTAQCLRDDVLSVTGKVGRKYRGEDGSFLVDLEKLNVEHGGSPSAAAATATLEMPSRTGALPAISRQRLSADRPSPNDDMPDFAKAMLGVVREGNREPKLPLTGGDIHLWCEALEDWNPLYWDVDFASASQYCGIVAPPAGLFYGADSSLNVGLGYRKPGAAVPEPLKQGMSGMPLLQSLREGVIAGGCPFPPPDCPEAVVTQVNFEFFLPVKVGDTLRTEQRLLNCSPLRRTKIGSGYFTTSENSVFNQRDELVRAVTMGLFCYSA